MRERLGYVPALNGVRGIAILVVLGSHAFVVPRGGFLGVDLFFVLSGFLITTLLLAEHARTGRISLRDFYERRARRLLPALLLLLAVYAAVAKSTGGHPLKATLAGLFYYADFAGIFGWHLRPIGQLWSLSVEEQFYLLWPLLLIVIVRFRRGALAWVVLLLLAALIAHRLSLTLHGAGSRRLDYAPDTRSDGLFVGCLLGIWYQRGTGGERLRTWCNGIAIIGVPIMGILLLAIQPGDRVLELGLLPVIVIYFGALVYAAADTTYGILTWRPLVFMGEISYALYLWHVPILYAFGTQLGSAHPLRSVGAVTVSLIAATLSTRYVEQPFRRRRRARLMLAEVAPTQL